MPWGAELGTEAERDPAALEQRLGSVGVEVQLSVRVGSRSGGTAEMSQARPAGAELPFPCCALYANIRSCLLS